MRQGVISQRAAWINEQCRFYLNDGVPIEIKVVWHNRPFEAIIQEVLSGQHDLLLKMAHQHDRFESVIHPHRLAPAAQMPLARCGW